MTDESATRDYRRAAGSVFIIAVAFAAFLFFQQIGESAPSVELGYRIGVASGIIFAMLALPAVREFVDAVKVRGDGRAE